VTGPLYVGIDCGSWNTKAALLDAGGRLLATAVARTGADVQAAAENVFAELLARAGVPREAVAATWSTGFGRHALHLAQASRTELDSHAAAPSATSPARSPSSTSAARTRRSSSSTPRAGAWATR
jgi:activator of 2-hydroxyglutaryl-CoA dehydratase